MAETAGVLLALPGIADVVLRAATALWDRFETYQTMDEVMSSLRETTLNLKEGTLSRGLANLQHVQKAQTVPKSTHDELEKCLRKLQADLSATLQGLDKVQDTHMGRLRYTIWRGPGSKHQLEQQDQLLKRSCSQLQAYCDMLHELRTGPSCYLWTSDMFKVKHETVNEAKFTILPDSGIFVCQGNYATSSRREDGNFILENKSRENDVQMLCSLLNEDKLQELQGLLPVLGYRQPPYNEPDGTKVFQLIVPLPKDVSWESLEHRIVRSEKPALLQRLDICLKLAKAVESIHTLELKHKSIRPRAVLLLGTPLDGDRAFKLYVQDWSFISKLSGATSLFGETNWQKSIYQHPERQGRYAEHAYDRKHDIYSLGVCILQVLLWQVFVQEATGAPDRICDLFETYALNRSGYSDSTGIPEKYRGNTQKITSKPWATQAIWREIAVGELDDVKLTRLVIRCLESDAAYAFREAKDVVKQLEVLLKQEQDGLNAPSYTTFGA